MILFHGSLNGKITRFGALQHFGTKAAALKRLGDQNKLAARLKKKGWLYKIRIKKVPKKQTLEVLDYGRSHHPWSLATMLAVGGSLTTPEGVSVYRQKTTGGSKRRLLKLLKDHGISLLHYENKVEGGVSWIVPNPDLIEILSVTPASKPLKPGVTLCRAHT